MHTYTHIYRKRAIEKRRGIEERNREKERERERKRDREREKAFSTLFNVPKITGDIPIRCPSYLKDILTA